MAEWGKRNLQERGAGVDGFGGWWGYREVGEGEADRDDYYGLLSRMIVLRCGGRQINSSTLMRTWTHLAVFNRDTL